MLSEAYKGVINDLITATNQGKLTWSRGNSPTIYIALPNRKTKVLIDTFYSEADQTTTSCIDLTIFENSSGKILDEIVICDRDQFPNDYTLLHTLYEGARDQFADKGLNQVLTEISASLKK